MFLGEYSADNGRAVEQKCEDIQLVMQLQRTELDRRIKVEKAKQKVFCEHGYGREMETELF